MASSIASTISLIIPTTPGSSLAPGFGEEEAEKEEEPALSPGAEGRPVRCCVWLSYRRASPGVSDVLLLLSLLCFCLEGFSKCVINIPVTYSSNGSKNEYCGVIIEHMHMATSLLCNPCTLHMLWLYASLVLASMKSQLQGWMRTYLL